MGTPRLFLIEFNERAKLAVPFTRDWNLIYKRIVHARPIGRTSLLDAVHLALSQMKKARYSRKAIVILSDGGDNRSRYTESEVKRGMREADVQVYAMGIFDANYFTRHPAEERRGPQLLDEMLKHSELMRLEIHGPAAELDKLRRRCGPLNPAWFVFQCGLDRPAGATAH